MRNLKRALCLALASVMVLGMTVIGASAATAEDFTDYDTVEEKEALDVMTEIGVIEGDGTGNFNPDGHFTREEAAKILSVLLLGADNAEKLNNNAQIFKDVASGRWSAGFIAYCSNVGIIAGDGQGNFNPEGELDSVSFGKMLLVALGYDPAKEGYINNPGWQQSISGDMIAAGIDVADVKFDDILTREQATVMAFKAIQTPLVEYANYLDPSKATYVTTTLAEEQTISSRVLSNTAGDAAPGTFTIEFAEKYHQDLIKSSDYSEEFRRPAHKWTYGSTNIGRYTDTPDAVYTTEVTTGQIYSDLGLSEKTTVEGTLHRVDGWLVDEQSREFTVLDSVNVSGYYIDGRPTYHLNRDPKPGEEIETWLSLDPSETNGFSFDKTDLDVDHDNNVVDYGYFSLENKGSISLGGNGTLTEVYYSPVSYNQDGTKNQATAVIVSVNTYVGDVTAKVGETDKHVAYITVTPRDDQDPDYHYDDPKPRTTEEQQKQPNPKEYISRYDTEDFALEDIVLFTYSKRRDHTDSSDSGIQSVKVADVVTGELSAYTENERVSVDSESYIYSNKVAKEAHAVDLNYDVDAVVDEYGYVIDVDPVGYNTGYAVIDTYVENSGEWDDTPAAKLVLTNGTVANAILKNVEQGDKYFRGDIVSYKVDNRGKYEITLEARANEIDKLEDAPQYGTSSKNLNTEGLHIANGKNVLDDILNSQGKIKADGNTIFILKDIDGNEEPYYTAYYGIKNVPTVDTKIHPASKGDATVLYKEDNVAVLVYVDATHPDTIIDVSQEDYVYVLFDPNVVVKHDTDRGDYYRYGAIVDGEFTTIDVNEKTYRAMDPRSALSDEQKATLGDPATLDLIDVHPESTLFTVVQVDDYDIYSLEGPQIKNSGIKPESHDVLVIGGTSLVAAEDCEVFYIYKNDAISENTVASVAENSDIKVSYFTDTGDDTGKLLCVVIDEAP